MGQQQESVIEVVTISFARCPLRIFCELPSAARVAGGLRGLQTLQESKKTCFSISQAHGDSCHTSLKAQQQQRGQVWALLLW